MPYEHPRPCPPRLNEPAPDFTAETTLGRRELADYAGRWLVFFSHPADFTPVCTSEFIAFANLQERFDALGCDLLGLSVDSVQSHLAWIRDIEESFGVAVRFPVIADPSMTIARRYGMVHPEEDDTSAVRTVFVIDPDGMVRAMLAYPMPTGRSVDEVLRLVTALKTCAEERLLTPEGWTPGDPTLLPPPANAEDAAAYPGRSSDAPAWYFRKALPTSTSHSTPGSAADGGSQS